MPLRLLASESAGPESHERYTRWCHRVSQLSPARSRGRRPRPGNPGWLLGQVDHPGSAGILGTSLTAFCVMRNLTQITAPTSDAAASTISIGWTAGCTARLLELRLAREAQRRPSHLHERGRLRRRHHAGAVRTAYARRRRRSPWYRFQHYYIWPLYCVHGAALADRRRRRGVRARQASGRERCVLPRGWDTRGRHRREGDLRHLGDRDPAARLSVVGRARRLPRSSRWSPSLIMADDVPARTLRRGGRRSPPPRGPRGRTTAGWAVHGGRDDGRLLPAQPRC